MMNIFQCKTLTYQYPEAEMPSLTDVSVNIRQGEFVLLIGASGSGKSTFLRSLNGLVPRFYGGKLSGEVCLYDQAIEQLEQRTLVSAAGFLNQDPERQLLLETVEREIVFGMENLGIDPLQMRSRLAEVSHLLGLSSLLSRKTASLSGGEKQLVALASVLTTYPQALLLDEPTSQLDPIHAEEVLHTIRRLNEEWGLTIVLSEHRLERCFHLADRIFLFEAGRVVFTGTPAEFASLCRRERQEWSRFLPPITRHFLEQQYPGLPLTVKEARSHTPPQGEPGIGAVEQEQGASERVHHRSWWRNLTERLIVKRQENQREPVKQPLLQLQAITAGYLPHAPIFTDFNYSIFSGDRIALLGENGAGKSTLAKLLAQVMPLSKGSLLWQGQEITERKEEPDQRIGYLSQNPNDYLLHDTVEEEIRFAVRHGHQATNLSQRVEELLQLANLTKYRHRHPHDLSGGERQLLALMLVLAQRPRVLLLDEPTRGLDLLQKEKLAHLLHTLPVEASLVITHDVEFAYLYANRLSILYQGEMVADGQPDEVFANSFSYMPQVHKYYRR